MLNNFIFENENPEWTRSEMEEMMGRLSRKTLQEKIPVLIVVDGWESSGKGFVISRLIKGLDPRYFEVSVFEEPTDEERKHPFMWRFWKSIPKKGTTAIFDRSIYFKLMHNLRMDDYELKTAVEEISVMEKQLHADDTIVLKIFLHETRETQAKRIREYEEGKYQSFFISSRDYRQNKLYDKYLKHFSKILAWSHTEACPWKVFSSEDLKACAKEVLRYAVNYIGCGIDRILKNRTMQYSPYRNYVEDRHLLNTVDLAASIEPADYRTEKKRLQTEIAELAMRFKAEEIPMVVVFEGMDAAGKGGCIRRLTAKIDPRLYHVSTTAKPSSEEYRYHYLWRFYRRLPKNGEITIFDRSWYGRVMVERIEGFATEKEWDRAYEEINDFELYMTRHDTLLIKFFLYIDSEEQYNRFKAREENPQKAWKLTDEDWRNREKWDAYVVSMNEMLARTDKASPWVLIAGNDKKYERIEVLKEVRRRMEEHLAAVTARRARRKARKEERK
ncbi:MAG: phosphate--AMP phosphotransferase [Eubacteriales bacterium]|nr:phosphate--AMP phosphotransferase [Eubacteriales bacterium]